ncbi:SulA-like leucine-rich domain-containing protein [Pseudoalteromonas sp. T1lg23B]|uniref:SulA-like leucine-rich domain-containing protein n=1 Tax=Pseudoalteromonas sp. T1lg23B TaxID=2077097 RepID=UPI000CF655C2|nr:SulA-like leucine-rich domain-containing protein [Pseudoalteromonas sp. T1lg23B]
MLHTSSVLEITASLPKSPVSNIHHVTTEDDICASLALLKIVHQCNQKQGWTLLIAPDNVPNKAMMDSCSIDTNKLLVIRRKHIVDLKYVLSSALNNGNFAAVIAWTDILSSTELTDMNLPCSDTEIFCFSQAKQPEKCTMSAFIS